MKFLLEHVRNVGFLGARWVFMHNNSLGVNGGGSPSGSGSEEFPGLTPKMFVHTHRKIRPPFSISALIVRLRRAYGAHSILTYLNKWIICTHASVHVRVLWALISGWGFPYWPVNRIFHSPQTKKVKCTIEHKHTHTHTHRLGYLSTEVCSGLEQSLIGESQWGIKGQGSPSADRPTSLLCSGCWLLDCGAHVFPCFRASPSPASPVNSVASHWKLVFTAKRLCSRSDQHLTNPTFQLKSHL